MVWTIVWIVLIAVALVLGVAAYGGYLLSKSGAKHGEMYDPYE